MLAEASTILELKEFKNLALTSADLAKRKGLGKQVETESPELASQLPAGARLFHEKCVAGDKIDYVGITSWK